MDGRRHAAGVPRHRVDRSRGGTADRTWTRRTGEVALFVAIAAVVAAVSCLPTPADGAPRVTTSRAVRVEAADTLWSIALANPIGGVPTADTVEAIRALNHLGPSDQLQPGAYVLVPRADAFDGALAMR